MEKEISIENSLRRETAHLAELLEGETRVFDIKIGELDEQVRNAEARAPTRGAQSSRRQSLSAGIELRVGGCDGS